MNIKSAIKHYKNIKLYIIFLCNISHYRYLFIFFNSQKFPINHFLKINNKYYIMYLRFFHTNFN